MVANLIGKILVVKDFLNIRVIGIKCVCIQFEFDIGIFNGLGRGLEDDIGVLQERKVLEQETPV